MTEYSATTSNATNKITATPEDENATVVIVVNEEEPVEDTELTATWESGENTVSITVENGSEDEGTFVDKTYTITVTKE